MSATSFKELLWNKTQELETEEVVPKTLKTCRSVDIKLPFEHLVSPTYTKHTPRKPELFPRALISRVGTNVDLDVHHSDKFYSERELNILYKNL